MKKTQLRGSPNIAFSNFYSWLLDRGFDELDVEKVVASSYNSDTETFSAMSYMPKRLRPNKVEETMIDLAEFTLMKGNKRLKKKIRAEIPLYAKEHTAHIMRNWEELRDLCPYL